MKLCVVSYLEFIPVEIVGRNRPLSCVISNLFFLLAFMYKWKHFKEGRCHEIVPELV